MRGDRLPPSIQTARSSRPPWVGVGSTRPGLVGRLPFHLEPFDQGLYPEPGDAVVASHLRLGSALHDDGGDYETGQRHGTPPRSTEVPTMSRDSCQLCRATSHQCREGESNPYVLA